MKSQNATTNSSVNISENHSEDNEISVLKKKNAFKLELTSNVLRCNVKMHNCVYRPPF